MKRWLLAVLLILALSAPGVSATEGVGGRPANPDPNNPRTQSIFIHELHAGETHQDGLVVANNSGQRQVIDVYATDGLSTNTGSFTCEQRLESSDDVGSWILLEQNRVELESGQNTTIPFKITAPSSPMPGEHNGCMVIQTAEPENAGGQNLNLHVRSAVRVVATVPGDLFKRISIDKFGVAGKGRAHRYDLTIANDGNVSADVRAKIRLATLIGDTVFEDQGEYPVLRENKLNVSFENDKLPFWGGFYFARATVVYDERPYAFGVQEGRTLQTATSDKKLVFVMPHPWAIVILLLILLIVLVFIRRRFMVWRLRREAESWPEYVVKKDDTLRTLAIKHDISWQKLARANRLRPPHAIKGGQLIHVPPKTRPDL